MDLDFHSQTEKIFEFRVVKYVNFLENSDLFLWEKSLTQLPT